MKHSLDERNPVRLLSPSGCDTYLTVMYKEGSKGNFGQLIPSLSIMAISVKMTQNHNPVSSAALCSFKIKIILIFLWNRVKGLLRS